MKSLAYINKYLLKYKFRLIFGLTFVFISNGFSVFLGPVTRKIIDFLDNSFKTYLKLQTAEAKTAFMGAFEMQLVWYGLLILGTALLSGLFLYFQRQMIIGMSRYIEYDLKNEIYAHYQTLPLSFYRKNNTGDLMSRISEDVGKVRMYLGPAIMYASNLVSLFIIIIPIMFMVNVKLTFYAILPLPFLTVTIFLIHNLMQKKSTEIQRGLARMSTYIQESFSGIRVIKAFVREKDSEERYLQAVDGYKVASMSYTKINSLFFPLILMLTGLSAILIVYVGGGEVMEGRLTVGNIAEFMIYLNKLTWPVAALGWITSMVQQAEASQKRINEFLNTKTDIVSVADVKKDLDGDISFENVSFTYPDSGINALKHISFHINKGESLAIIGATGSGKSTIANLLCRLYDTSSGKILVDGRDIKDYSLSSLRSQIGYVPQDVFLFSDTIRNNIAFGSDNITEEQIAEAAKDADFYNNIIDFPDKFETILGERGITLSGGQKQRLSIARAIVRKPRLLILDDSLSAVDTKTENAILNNLERIMQNRTTLIISHRVSSAKLAHKIIVLDDGQLVEQGSHEELLAHNGAYRQLYQKQTEEETEKA